MKRQLQCNPKTAIIFLFIFLSLWLYPTGISAKLSSNDSILAVLNMEIDRSQTYYLAKEKKINNLRSQYTNQTNQERRLEIANKLFEEYFTWQYDSAFVYVRLSEELATELNNETLITQSRLNLIRSFISSGYYKEGFELIESMQPESMPDKMKGEYYKLCLEYYDALMIYYDNEYYTGLYTQKALDYYEKAKHYFEPGTAEYAELEAYAFRLTDATPREKIQKYHDILNTYTYTDRDLAYMYILMSVQYTADGDKENAIYYSALSAICDIRAAIRQTTSKTILGQHLYEEGKVMFASKCIKSSLDDANFFNARQRMAQLNSILPIVEYDKVGIIEHQKDRLSLYLFLLGLLVVFLLIALFVIYKQIKKLQKARESIRQQLVEISDINKELATANTKLETSNNQLAETNSMLAESNYIKDMYIVQSLYGKSEYIDRIELLIKRVDRMITAKQYNELKTIKNDFNSRIERENMYSSFDKTFVQLFPNFVDEYNKFFAEEDRVTIDAESNLSPELRVFALMRLGISDNERIAKFLNVSVKTIYTYKYKVKTKTIIPKEELEYRIMQIKRQKSKPEK